MTDEKKNSIRAIDRAVDILECFSKNESELSIDTIVIRTKLAKTTVYRMLYTLRSRGLIRYNESSALYSLGFNLLALSSNLDTIDILKSYASESLDKLQEETQQTILMVVPEGDSMIYIYTKENSIGLKFASYTGQKRSINYGVLGKVFTAYMDDKKLEQLKNAGLTIEQSAEIRENIQQNQYYIEREETNIGVTGVASPILDANNQCIAVIGLIGPSAKLTEEELSNCKNTLLKTANEISHELPLNFTL